MSLESGLFALVIGQTAVTDIIDQRFTPSPLKEGATLPAITYDVVSITPTLAHDGDVHLDFANVQLNLWTETATEAVALRDVARTALNGFRGTVAGEQFDKVAIVNISPIPEPDVQEIRVMMELDVMHRYEDPT